MLPFTRSYCTACIIRSYPSTSHLPSRRPIVATLQLSMFPSTNLPVTPPQSICVVTGPPPSHPCALPPSSILVDMSFSDDEAVAAAGSEALAALTSLNRANTLSLMHEVRQRSPQLHDCLHRLRCRYSIIMTVIAYCCNEADLRLIAAVCMQPTPWKVLDNVVHLLHDSITLQAVWQRPIRCSCALCQTHHYGCPVLPPLGGSPPGAGRGQGPGGPG